MLHDINHTGAMYENFAKVTINMGDTQKDAIP